MNNPKINSADYEILIRKYRESDQEELLKLWYDVSFVSHPFIPADFWAEHIEVLKEKYLPASDTYVAESKQRIVGFISLMGNYVGALFVADDYQNQGVGTKLLSFCRRLRGNLYVDVYKENARARDFYKRRGFLEKKEKNQEETGCQVITMVG